MATAEDSGHSEHVQRVSPLPTNPDDWPELLRSSFKGLVNIGIETHGMSEAEAKAWAEKKLREEYGCKKGDKDK